MTDKKASSTAKQSWDILEEGAAAMWHDVFANTVLEMLAEDTPVTAKSLSATLEERMIADGIDRLTRAKLRGALKQIRS